MRARQFASLVMMLLYLAGCTSWRVQPVTPQQLPNTDRPYDVRVYTRKGETVVLEQAFVRNDSLMGSVNGLPLGIPLDEIAGLERKRTDAAKTVLLGVGVAVVVGAIVAAIAINESFSGGCALN